MEDEYENKIKALLLRMKPSEIFIISENVQEANRARFTDIVKSYIDRNFMNADGFQILFSNDYSKIKKDTWTLQ